MEYFVKFRNLCQIETRRYILIVGVIAVAYLMFQSFMLPYGNALRSLLPDNDFLLSVKSISLSGRITAVSTKEGEIVYPDLVEVVKGDERSDVEIFDGSGNGVEENGRIGQDGEALEGEIQNEPIGLDKHSEVNSSKLVWGNVGKVEQILEAAHEVLRNSDLALNETSSVDNNEDVEGGNKLNTIVHRNVNEVQQSQLVASMNDSEVMDIPRRRNKVRPGMPPVSVVSLDEMHRRLTRYITTSSKMKPQWSSVRDCDKELIDAKSNILNAPASVLHEELYAPVFRNVSKFIRSYELMEKTLKVFVYKDGKKPIFHQPILKGLYASEGWFMKLMEANKHFVVKNPEKAHLFYMPFSSRMLEYALYIPNSHNRTKLRQFVKVYSESIAAKYPFWNRTGGTDHFVVACHDWALYETRHHMENSIKALCNADVTIGFKIGRDVSLPETFVRYARNPLRDLGGNPPSRRNILAFYAGNSHGYLRPILLKHWKGKDPDIRIYGLLPTGVARKKNYMQHMKSSKYCICPKGFEVNSPRVVEAIFYECVPVIISDNFVPPFFEVLNWEAFSVIVAEKEIPNLKNILLSIPEEKYLAMQLAVRRVQKHFLWHARPVKYDLFHMILHSIWYSRVFQIQR